MRRHRSWYVAMLVAAAAMMVLLGAKCSLFNKAPTVPAVTGPGQGVAGVPVTFKATATDPDGDSIALQFDWGDTTMPAWSVFLASGETLTATHSYADSGTYSVRAKAKDYGGKESGWSGGRATEVRGVSGYPDSIFGEFAVGIRAKDGIVTPDGRLLYVLHDECDFLTPVRLSDRAVLPTVTVGRYPYSLAATPDGQFLYVACNETTLVYVVRTADDSVVSVVNVGHKPRGVVVAPDGERAYVSLWQDRALKVIRTSDNTVVDSLLLASEPRRLAIDPSGALLYVTLPYLGRVAVIRTEGLTLVDSLEAGLLPALIVCDQSGDRLYVTNQTDSGFVAIDIATRQPAFRCNLHDPRPSGITVMPDDRYVLAVNWYGLHAFDAAGGHVDSLASSTADGLAIAPSGDTAYIIAYNRVFVVGKRHR